MPPIPVHPYADESLLPLPRRSVSVRASGNEPPRAAAAAGVSLEQVSNMLWVGFGRNCRGSGGRSVAGRRGAREVEAYVCLPDGCYRYDACDHALLLLSPHDARAWTGSGGVQPGPALALVYVTELVDEADSWEESGHIPGTDVATIAGKVAACAAASGLVARGEEWFHPQLAHLLRLRAGQRIALTQTVTVSSSSSH